MSASEKLGEYESKEGFGATIFKNIELSLDAEQLWNTVFGTLQTFNIHSISYYHMPPIGAHDVDTPYFKRIGQKEDLSRLTKIIFFDIERSFIHKVRSIDEVLSLKDFMDTSNLSEEQTHLFSEIHGESTLHGFVIPCHSANGRSGCVVVETLKSVETYKGDTLRLISAIALSAHKAYSVLKRAETRPIKQLTAREKQILTWVAHGKSNSVIADIIGISQHTVNGYLRSIYLKTNTSDRTTAVLRGLGDGLIDL